MAKEPMSLQEMLAKVGKGQNFMVLNLLTQAYNEGFKAGAEEARDAAFKAGYTEGVKKAIGESPAYLAGITDGIDYTVCKMHGCICAVLHDRYRFGHVRLARTSDDLFNLFNTTLHPADLRERLAKIGVNLNAYDPFVEED